MLTHGSSALKHLTYWLNSETEQNRTEVYYDLYKAHCLMNITYKQTYIKGDMTFLFFRIS